MLFQIFNEHNLFFFFFLSELQEGNYQKNTGSLDEAEAINRQIVFNILNLFSLFSLYVGQAQKNPY